MKKVKIIITLVIGFIFLIACGRGETGIANHYMVDECVGYEAELLLVTEEPIEYETENQNGDEAVTPISAQILLNGERVSLPGYAIYGQNYFRIDDIAYMLRDTLARFTFSCWGFFRWPGQPVFIDRHYHGFDRRDDRPASEGEFHRTNVRISASIPVSSGGTTPRNIIAPIETFITESHLYFTIEALGGFLGFTIEHAPYGVILIDTSEPNISEYGRRAAEDFLSLKPSLFPRPPGNEDTITGSFLLYDINGNGIPDIFIRYSDQPDVYAIYVYFDGSYTSIGTVNIWHELVRDGESRIYAICGDWQSGFTDVRMLTIFAGTHDGDGWSSVTSPQAFLTNNNEGLTFLTDMNKPLTSIRPLGRDLAQDISESITLRLAIPAETTPVIAQILLNGELTYLAGHTIEGRNYFRLSDIAYMLQDTRAHFDFTEDRWSLHNTNIRIDRRSVFAANTPTIDSGNLYPVKAWLQADMTLGSTHGDVSHGGAIVFGTEDATYFALEDLSGFLGFFIDNATDGTVIINTNESIISEYGRRVAEEFLMQMPTTFHPYPWSDEILANAEPRRMSDIMGRDEWHTYDDYVFPNGFMLHDFRGNGIPDIFVSYWFWDWPVAYVIYSYIDEGYRRIGVVSQYGEIFHDRQGRVFFLEGTHQMGFDTMRTLTFIENDVEWDNMQLLAWYPDIYIDERDRFFWENWTCPTPVMPDNPSETLTTNRFLRDLTQCVAESIKQMLID